MLLKFGTHCRSRGERLGTLWALSVEPSEKLLLRAIIEEPQGEPLVRRLVPFSRLDQADDEQVVVGMTRDEFQALPCHDPGGGRGGRKRSGRRRRGDEPVTRVVTARTRVACRDGEVGSLDALSVDPRTGDLTDLSFEFGHPTTRDLAVAIQHVEEVRDELISLALSMDDLADFPSRRT